MKDLFSVWTILSAISVLHFFDQFIWICMCHIQIGPKAPFLFLFSSLSSFPTNQSYTLLSNLLYILLHRQPLWAPVTYVVALGRNCCRTTIKEKGQFIIATIHRCSQSVGKDNSCCRGKHCPTASTEMSSVQKLSWIEVQIFLCVRNAINIKKRSNHYFLGLFLTCKKRKTNAYFFFMSVNKELSNALH